MSHLTKPEWIAACAERIRKNTGATPRMARIEASTLADEQTARHGASGAAWMAPAAAADQVEEGGSE